ncbi:PAS domain-containing protein [candidate division WOR-3 bacterium]|nr:PAS domain-containing protein [candidate division WOR-3 bacterium]
MIPSWIISIFNTRVFKKNVSYELDKNKESLNHLIELTNQLDKMEMDIRQHNRFLRLVADSLDIPVWVKDIKGRFLFLNTSCAEKILRTTVDKALNLTDLDFENDALAKVCVESDKRVQSILKVCRFIEYAQYTDYALWLDVTKSPLIIDGKLLGVVGSAKDITKFVPTEIKNRFKEYGLMEIDIGLVYSTIKNGGKNENDLKRLLEKNKMWTVL